MGNPTQRPADFRRALNRLTGDSGRRGEHVFVYAINVRTADGQPYGLRLSAGITVKTPKPDMGRLKRRLCLAEHGIDVAEVLDSWTPPDLRAYVEANLSREDLERYRGG